MPKPTYTEKITQNLNKPEFKRSVPFIASVAGYNANSHSFKDISRAWDTGDLETLLTSPSTSNYVRVLVPTFIKKFVELRLDIRFQCNASQPTRTLKIALARRTEDHSNPEIGLLEIDRQTRMLGGPWTLSNAAIIELDHVNLLPIVNNLVNFDEKDQFFWIDVYFDAAPASWQSFTRFRVLGSGYIPLGEM